MILFNCSSVNLPKTQIEDSPATDNKLESILDLPGDEEKEEKERELSQEEAADDTDGGEEEELVHDDAQSMSRDKQDPVEQNKPEEKAEKTIREKPPVPVNAIVITEDGIMERLLAAEAGFIGIVCFGSFINSFEFCFADGR